MNSDYISNIIENIGIEKEYKGFHFLIDAIEIITQDETTLLNIGKRVYEPIANKCGCSKAAVERNIHTVVLKAWKNNRQQIEKAIGKKFISQPKTSEFIDRLSYYVYKIEKGHTNQDFQL